VSPRRVAIVTTQLLGFDAVGGVGAATASLAIALARIGHDVDVLYIKEQPPNPLDAEWARRYEDAGVGVRRVPAYEVPIEPASFRRMRAVELALRADTPDVVIAHEYGAPAYIALRLRQLGLAFQDTLFVVYCHGTGPWVKEVNGNPRVAPEMLLNARLEQMGVELADVVVSPSAYLVGWMREARVIPLVTQATALGEAPPRDGAVESDGRVERLAYFGRLEERKGIRPFVAALNGLQPDLLEGVDVEFLGGPSKNWDPDRVTAELSERTRCALRSVSFETSLGREEALARLERPGTLAVMPSLAENSPNVVYECLEAHIPFLASDRGGMGELVAPDDRARVLFQPTAEGIAAALRRALAEEGALRPARAAFDGAEVVSAWADVVGTEAPPAPRAEEALPVEGVDVVRSLDEGSAEWMILLEEGDIPTPELVETLVRAQAASGADVVSCGLLHHGREHYFLGEPGGVGLLANRYGTAALIRRALIPDLATAVPAWPLLAQLNAAGARIVSVPIPLLTSDRAPATLARAPAEALLVAEALERVLPDQARLLARLVAGLAAEQAEPPPSARLRGRVGRVLGALVGRKPGRETRGAA
jgi:glycosyltransferase involved in cell wall biosynthesis